MNNLDADAVIREHLLTVTGATPIAWPNRDTVDPANPPEIFLMAEVEFGPQHQVTIGNQALVRQIGQLAVVVSIKHGEGTQQGEALQEALIQAFRRKALGPPVHTYAVVFKTPLIQRPLEDDGRYLMPLAIPFWTDVLSD